MLVCEGTVLGVEESPPRMSRNGEEFTTWSLHVYGGGDQPYYLDLPKNFDRGSLPAAGSPVRAAVSIRPYVSGDGRAGASLALRALLPSVALPVGA